LRTAELLAGNERPAPCGERQLTRVLFGLEEEIFITEPDRPTLQSLYYLAKLLWCSPRVFYAHTACNFSRGKDLRFGLMSGIEISTETHADRQALLSDLAQRRQALAEACPALLVPLGHLLDHDEPTNVCGMHLHLSGMPDFDRAYRNLIYFLPLLTLIVANAPGFGDYFYGPSYRWANSFAVGPLRDDRMYRFQDVIFSKRLGTLEIRVFDPVWDLGLIGILLDCVEAVLTSDRSYPGSPEQYNRLRSLVAHHGYIEELNPVYRNLRGLIDLPERSFQQPPAYLVWNLLSEYGVQATYTALDSAYRGGPLEPRDPPPVNVEWAKIAAGVCGYYLPRLPYSIRKVWQEW